jgi:molybdopterin synthase sulfur carrier subunit
MIKIKYFAKLSENLDANAEELEFGVQSETVDKVIQLLVNRGEPWVTEFTAETNVLIAVNQEMADRHTAIKEGDEVAFFPPVTGG